MLMIFPAGPKKKSRPWQMTMTTTCCPTFLVPDCGLSTISRILLPTKCMNSCDNTTDIVPLPIRDNVMLTYYSWHFQVLHDRILAGGLRVRFRGDVPRTRGHHIGSAQRCRSGKEVIPLTYVVFFTWAESCRGMKNKVESSSFSIAK